MRRSACQRFEQLEDRRLMTVMADVIRGDLMVTGTPDGEVQVIATGPQSFDVHDAGELVASVEGVNDDIHIELQSGEGDSDDAVTLDLAEADVDRVFVNLGGGENHLMLASGSTGGSVQYHGGSGSDVLEVAEDFQIGRGLSAFLGDGDNSFEMLGAVERSMRVYAGAGDDEIRLGENSEVGRRLTLRPGQGDNTAIVEGAVGGALYYRGGVGDDLIDILASANIEGRTTAWMGHGDNDLHVEGALGSHLSAIGGQGDDNVVLAESAEVDGNAQLRLGDGDDLIVAEAVPQGRLIMDNPDELFREPEPLPEPLPEPEVDDAPNNLQPIDLSNLTFEFNGIGRFL